LLTINGTDHLANLVGFNLRRLKVPARHVMRMQ